MEVLDWIFVLAVGGSFGALANVLIYRIPNHLSIVLPNSFCTECKTPRRWRDKIPLVSFILLRGRCRYCQAKIPYFYPLSECLGALLGLFCYLYFPVFSALAFFFLVLFFYVLSVIDVRFLEIPDSINLLTFVLSLLFALLYYGELFAVYIGLAFVGFATFLRFFVGFLSQKEVLGEGDLLLFGVIGTVLGVLHGAVAIFLAAFYALVLLIVLRVFYGRKDVAIPFVPFLFLGFFSAFVWQIV